MARGVYPAHREADVVLRDGSTVHVRPVRPEDEPALLEFYRSLSLEARTFRFFSPAVNLEAAARRDCHVDYVNSFTLVATAGPEPKVIGVASYVRVDTDRAEVGFAVADAYRGRGLGTILLGHLAEIAAANGINLFEAVVMPTNYEMIKVFRDSGFPVEIRLGPDEIRVTLPTSLTPEARERFEGREQVATINALRNFFYPRAVAVIGASRRRDSVGGALFRNLLDFGFEGPVYPVNINAPVVQSVVAYPTVEAVPGPVDLAVIAVPAERVAEVAEQCGRKGVRALVVISAGFAEVGEEGRAREAELLRVCRAYGMRLIGPNCIGIINTDPALRLNATFGPVPPPAGRVGFASQSGALGLAIIDYARTFGLGLSTFVSMGNKADISGNDLLQYWEVDPNTDVILLYLESFGNPRKFSRIARRVGRKKPIVAVKGGRSSAGARATTSHTGALLAASDVTVDALFRQSGVIRTDTLEGLFEVAALLANQPLPAGRRVGIVSNAGGPAVLAADACEAQGLAVPVLSPETQARLRAVLAPEASIMNPVDMTATATADHYRQALEAVAADPAVDALIVVFLPPLRISSEEVAAAIAGGARYANSLGKPVLSVFISSRGVPEELRRAEVRVPSYAFPENAAIALAHVVRYAEWRSRLPSAPPRFEDIRRDEAAAIVAQALGRGGGWLGPDQTWRLLECYGLAVVRQVLARTPEEAARAAEGFGGEVVLKAFAPGLTHKTERGAVRLGLRGADQVRAAAGEMARRLGAEGFSELTFAVQEFVGGGVEMLAGMVHDRHFGPVVVCGAGGVFVEVLKDIAVRLTPLTRDDAAEMVRELKSYPLLGGFRGAPPVDVAAFEETLLRLSALAEDLPDVAEVDLNPVLVRERGATILDARVRVEPAQPPPPLGARTRPAYQSPSRT